MNNLKFYCPPMSYKLWYKNDEGNLTYDHHIPGEIIPQYHEPVKNAVDNAPYFIRLNHPNVVGIAPDIEVIDGELCGILKVTTDSELSQEDMTDLQEALTDRISKWSIYFENQEIKTDGGDLYVRFYDSNAPILSETAYRNKSYVENNPQEFDNTKFYFNDDAGRVTMMYYNPDSTSGGQLVENNLYMDTLKEMLDECQTTEQFWNCFHGNAKQYLIDIDTPEFEAAAKNFSEEPCDCSDETIETMDSIRNWVIEQCEDLEQVVPVELPVTERFEAKIEKNFAEYAHKNMELSLEEVFDRTREISVVQDTYNDLLHTEWSEAEIDALMTYDDPLELISDIRFDANREIGTAAAVEVLIKQPQLGEGYLLDESHVSTDQSQGMGM